MYGSQGMFMYKIIYYLLFEHLNSHANISTIQPYVFNRGLDLERELSLGYSKQYVTTSISAPLLLMLLYPF